jgi:hypothetical protein
MTVKIIVDTQCNDFELLKQQLIGQKVKTIELYRGGTYSKDGESFQRFAVYFEDGSQLRFEQDTAPIDDEDEHRDNDLLMYYNK